METLASLLIKKKAVEAGFDLVGIAPVQNLPDLEFARKWTEKGYAGEMHYLKNPKRADPRKLLPTLRSAICVGLVYNTPRPYFIESFPESSNSVVSKAKEHLLPTEFKQSPESRGWVSRYAWGRDYHEVLRKKLNQLRGDLAQIAPDAQTRVCVDTSPLVERAFARLSGTGLGWMGKNTCLIHPEKGSWFFLGVLLTSLALEPDVPAPDRCGSCTRCLEACPTGAFPAPYLMDASRCISYFTIELRGAVPVEFREAVGSHLFGCDICQDVCPWNRRAATTQEEAFFPLPLPAVPQPKGTGQGQQVRREENATLCSPPLERLASLTEDDFRRLFRHSPVQRAKFRGWRRNLSVAMGNSGNRKFIPWLEKLAKEDDEMLREHATWALEKLQE